MDVSVVSEVAQATSPRTWLLVPSFVLGPESWRGVAEILELLNQQCVVPAPTMTTPRHDDHLEPWLNEVLAAVPPVDSGRPLVAVGHSASCPRMPMVVDALLDAGHQVETMILVNGRFPEDQVVPTDRDFPFRDMLDKLVRPDDYLPPWHRWWGPMIEDMLPDDEARSRVLGEARPVPLAIFEQAIPAPKLGSEVGVAFLAMGEMYRPSYDEAKEQGWAIAKIDGEHLHMVVDPVLVAGTLLSLVGQANRSRS